MKKTFLALIVALLMTFAGLTACNSPKGTSENGGESVDYASALKNSATAIAATVTDEREVSTAVAQLSVSSYSLTSDLSNDWFKQVAAPVAATMVYFAGILCDVDGYNITQNAVQFNETYDFTFGGDTVLSTQKMHFTIYLTVDAEADQMVLMIHHQVNNSNIESDAWDVDYNFVCELNYDFDEEKLNSFKLNAYSGTYIYCVYNGQEYLQLEGDELAAIETLFNGYYSVLGEKEATATAGSSIFGQKYVEATQYCGNLLKQNMGISIHGA